MFYTPSVHGNISLDKELYCLKTWYFNECHTDGIHSLGHGLVLGSINKFYAGLCYLAALPVSVTFGTGFFPTL